MAAALEKKIRKNQFTLEDFLEQMGQIKKMGGITKLMGMIPGMNSSAMKNVDVEKSEREFVQMEAIIQSMTREERENPSILNASRRRRISAGSAMTNYKEKPRPFKLLETGVRVIDTVNPIVEGGTGFLNHHETALRVTAERAMNTRKVQIDGKSLESAENRLKNVLADFERQRPAVFEPGAWGGQWIREHIGAMIALCFRVWGASMLAVISLRLRTAGRFRSLFMAGYYTMSIYYDF